ncbi:hypothetical protein H696_02719 [Fonticula alba]|uniref:THH1/TOM1/TOM3 domain-containing protein n=1 Tax=Fonticula alba TaxID=691883 RepID=A0A058Z7W1_FONAL|nr:hypothetical protein H696_02719 [Fonticula alba]KCV70384.1 hypothetical protein H696_02719 [Fonticula alba]|eukprot:XP_009494900.1 hypothetical protein H696_02719 [Fonticula alba]
MACSVLEDAAERHACFAMSFITAGLYLALFGTSARLLFLRFRLDASHKWQIFFHSFIMVGCLIRICYMCYQPFSDSINDLSYVILNSLPSFIFFSAYFVFLFFWAELYHYSSGRIRVFKKHYITANVTMYTLLTLLYIARVITFTLGYQNGIDDAMAGVAGLLPAGLNARLSHLLPAGRDHTMAMADGGIHAAASSPSSSSATPAEPSGSGSANDPTFKEPVEMTIHLYTALVYFILAVGYFFYGTQLYLRYGRFPTITVQRRDQQRDLLRRLGFVTLLCTFFFTGRAAIIVAWTFLDWTQAWYFDSIYFIILEIIPVFCLFYIFDHTGSPSQQQQQQQQQPPAAAANPAIAGANPQAAANYYSPTPGYNIPYSSHVYKAHPNQPHHQQATHQQTGNIQTTDYSETTSLLGNTGSTPLAGNSYYYR